MDDYQDIGVVAVINILTSVILLVAFSILRHHWSHREFYFPRRYRKEKGGSPTISRSYLRIFNWVPAALRMSEAEVIDQAGLDSAVYLRIYLLGLKIFVPITVLSFFVLVPVNYTGESPEHIEDLTFSTLDKFSISNVPPGSGRNQVLLVMAYVFSFLICYEVYKEDANIATMRLRPLACENLRPDRYSNQFSKDKVGPNLQPEYLDMMERAGETNLDLSFLQNAYVHPVLQGCKLEKPSAIDEEENKPFVPV